MFDHLFQIHAGLAGKPFVQCRDGGVRIMGDHGHFHAIAGGQQRGFTNGRMADCLLQDGSDILGTNGQAFAQFNRRRAVIQAYIADTHRENLAINAIGVQYSVFFELHIQRVQSAIPIDKAIQFNPAFGIRG